MSENFFPIGSYCTSPAWGGLEMNVLRSLVWMKERGWSCFLYACPGSRMYEEARQRGLTVRPVKPTIKAGDLVNASRLSAYLKQDGIRRLEVHQSKDYFVGVFAKLFTGRGLKLVSSQHMHIGGTKKDLYHAWLYRRFDAWSTPVEWLKDRVLEKTVLPPEKIHIIPRCIDVERFTANKPSRSEARRYYGLGEEDIVIGLIGRLDPKKCQDVVISALALVHQRGYRAHLLLVGDQSHNEGDAYAERVHRLVGELELTEFVHFHPHEEVVERAYAALDIFTMASRSECYGMVTVEAMVSGVPMIGTNDGGTVSLIDHGRTGLLVPPKDVKATAAAIIRLLENPAETSHMGEVAQREALKKYSHHQQCQSWEKLFRGLDG